MHDPVVRDMPAFARWNDLLGSVLRSVGGEAFPEQLEAALYFLAPFQMMNGFYYSADGRAFDLYNEKSIVERRIIVDQYLAGAYILDPFYDTIRTNPEPRLILMRDLAPDDFTQSEYYRRHYASTGISDEVGFVFNLGTDNIAVLSLCRGGANDRFSDLEVDRFKAAANVVCWLGEQHWTGTRVRSKAVASSAPAPSIEHPLLTPREREIVVLILKGHSTASIAMVLALSLDTVKAHRRHIYAKLNISSQAELFHMFFASPYG